MNTGKTKSSDDTRRATVTIETPLGSIEADLSVSPSGDPSSRAEHAIRVFQIRDFLTDVQNGEESLYTDDVRYILEIFQVRKKDLAEAVDRGKSSISNNLRGDKEITGHPRTDIVAALQGDFLDKQLRRIEKWHNETLLSYEDALKRTVESSICSTYQRVAPHRGINQWIIFDSLLFPEFLKESEELPLAS